jgi:hypothetical protein
MDRRIIILLDWLAVLLLGPLTFALVWKMIGERFKGRELSSDLIILTLLSAGALIGVIGISVSRGWLSWALLLLQIILLVLLFKRLWTPLKQKLRD